MNSTMERMNALEASVDALSQKHAPKEGRYVVTLRSGEQSHAGFYASQVQFGFAVRGFSQPLALLAASAPDATARLPIVANLWEEHGNGTLSKSHAATFDIFLQRLAPSAQAVPLEGAPSEPVEGEEVAMFNAAIKRVCREESFRHAAAVLGMIEHMFAKYSDEIARAVIARGFLSRQQLVHYSTHEELDVEHAQDLFELCLPAFHGTGAVDVNAGLQFGAEVFHAFYDGLSEVALRDPNGTRS